MRKFRLFTDYNKEEKWLNEMYKKGYELKNISFGYKFYSIEPENATVRIDYRIFKNKEDFIDYCTLFEDSGWKHLAGNKNSGVQYFKEIHKNSQEDIFSDDISKAARYKRLSNKSIISAVCFLSMSVAYISSGSININLILNPKLLYYTPGLWERTGEAFWGGLLFETPFALGRSAVFLIPIIAVFYAFLAIKARILYNKGKNLIKD
ncbi:hypothetical protein N486_05135 [Clostridium botulinum B2 128]|uniref:DUF2812 domain-containing protein n=1 Tax=Clostridium botulinum TaxID=1491 RepID=UPI000581F923|nr:DUF2812 domain-containing protein [Clostridium botulinum]KEI75181.1 hypothetical protein N486_05135 [Clostridium botulinum B2 128]KEI88901.1 hypothetical protein N493_05090 [Clostridium botulinum B2 433]NFI41655.1 DUF2812 domain-containing protein [Clostridium botulinum]NFI76915.1 DUF2812 domain-containing protein [Clostridium botulinum]NFI83784.1 DUF2812 domain-containing protein [Clostridium botulinum]